MQTLEALRQLSNEMMASSGFAFDVETAPQNPDVRGVDPMRSSLVGLSISMREGQGFYIPVGHLQGDQIPVQSMVDTIKIAFEIVKELDLLLF